MRKNRQYKKLRNSISAIIKIGEILVDESKNDLTPEEAILRIRESLNAKPMIETISALDDALNDLTGIESSAWKEADDLYDDDDYYM